MKRKRKKARKPLTETQKQVAQLFFDGYKVGDAASIVGVHRCTIWRWSKRRDFRQEINRISNRYSREIRKQLKREYYHSPEYKRMQSRKYYARRRLKVLAERLEKAGNSGNMAEYQKASAAYNKCFNEAYFGGKTAFQILKMSRILANEKKERKVKKYIVEIID